MPVVPVARFWSTAMGCPGATSSAPSRAGRLDGFEGIVVEDSIHDALAASLGISIHAGRPVAAAWSASAGVARRGGLGLVAASDLRPSLRALAVDGRTIFGNDRVRRVAEWPLLVTMASRADATLGPARTWVLVAGGDSFTDRGVYDTVVSKGRGVDFPFGGGTARVTGHAAATRSSTTTRCPVYTLTGNSGAVRKLFRDADLAIVNHESPIADGWSHHREGFTFTGKPDLTRIFTDAGIDFVSLANNHIKDHGSVGIDDTRRVLSATGSASAEPARTSSRPATSADSRSAGSASRSSPASTWRRPLGRAADERRRRPAGDREGYPRGRSAMPTSSSSSRTGAPSTRAAVERAAVAGRSLGEGRRRSRARRPQPRGRRHR